MSSPYQIRIYDTSDTLVKMVANVQSARFRLAENEVGDWELVVPFDERNLPESLAAPNRVEFWKDGVFVFGGIIRRTAVTQDGRVPFYTASGPSYLQWIQDARMHPSVQFVTIGVPVHFATATTGTGDILLDPLDLTILARFLALAQVQDRAHNFEAEIPGATCGNSLPFTATAYSSVLETMQDMAKRGNFTFDITRDSDGKLRYHTYYPSRGPDRSKGTSSPVLFDLRGGNITNAEWIRDGNAVVNTVWGGGPGDKAARYIYPPTVGAPLQNAASVLDWGRIEGFVDAGSETTSATDKKITDELAKLCVPEESVTFTISQFGRYTLGEDFQYGSKVTVVWSPILEFTDTIRGMEVRLDSGAGLAAVDINVGDTITGDNATRASLYLGRFLRSIRRSIGVQQRH